MKNFLRKIIRKIFSPDKPIQEKETKYKIGNVKYHNSLIDGLIPQFVEIGDNFISAPGSIILAHDASLFIHTGKYRLEKTILGNNVFLGANAVILPGIRVGDGAIIGAGSIVTKDVDAYSVVAGNPARFISTVSDYIKKIEKKGALYTPPESFKEFFKGQKISKDQILEFQNHVIFESKKSKQSI